MKVTSAILLLLISVLIGARSHSAATSIAFPSIEGSPSLSPGSAGFAFDFEIGFTVVQTAPSHKLQLLSFSVTEARILDQLDLEPDFASGDDAESWPWIVLKVHPQSGLLVIYGQQADARQRLIAAKSDCDGRLRKLWSLMLPSPGGFFSLDSDLAVNLDGSRICWIHYSPEISVIDAISAETHRQNTPPTKPARMPLLVRRSTAESRFVERNPQVRVMTKLGRRLALIRVDDGSELASADLRSESLFSSSVFYDDVNNRVVALAEATAYVFTAGSDTLDLDFTLTPDLRSSPVIGQGMSRDGRFLLGYGGYSPDEIGSGLNSYVTYDLAHRTTRELDLDEQLFPFANGMTFHREAGLLFAPLVAKLTLGGGDTLNDGMPRQTDIIRIESDGSLRLAAQMTLPKRSGDGSRPKLSVFSNVEVSVTGALAFIQADNNRLFAFDTANGEIVDDGLVDGARRLASIRLLEPLNCILASDLSGKNLLVINASTAPAIASVKVKRHSTIIIGENFLSGAHLLINGVDQGLADRDAENPGSKIKLDRGKKDFAPGEDFTLVVVNRDGASSKPFTFQR